MRGASSLALAGATLAVAGDPEIVAGGTALPIAMSFPGAESHAGAAFLATAALGLVARGGL